MSDRDEFKKILNNREGTFFKFYENGSLLRYGFKNKYFFESKVLKIESRRCKSFNGTDQKMIIVYLYSFNYIEGKVHFDASAQTIDGVNDTYIIFILTHKLHTDKFKALRIDNLREKYLEQIIQHEMNHHRTNDLLKNVEGETNNFTSEVLADSLLILENSKDEEFITIKRTDIELLLKQLKDGYYKDYLEVVHQILASNNPEITSKLVLDELRKNEDNNISTIKEKLLNEITTTNNKYKQ